MGTEEDKELGKAIIGAWKKDGILQIAMNPQQQDLYKSANEASKRFFGKPYSQKAACVDSQSYAGYIASGEELTDGIADYSEIFTVTKDLELDEPRVPEKWPCHGRCPWPDAQLRNPMEEYMNNLDTSGERLLELTELGLGVPRGSLTNLTQDGWHHMRILRFPAANATNGKGKSGRGIGSHTDYGLLVLAAADEVGALFIRPPHKSENLANWKRSGAGFKEDDEGWVKTSPAWIATTANSRMKTRTQNAEPNKTMSSNQEDVISRLAEQHATARRCLNDGDVQSAASALEAASKHPMVDKYPHALELQYDLAQAYKEVGKLKEAIAHLESVVAAEETLPEKSTNRLASQFSLAQAYQEDGQSERAIALLKDVVAAESTLPPSHPTRLASLEQLAFAYKATGNTTEAVRLLEEVVEGRKALSEDASSRLASEMLLVSMYRHEGEFGKAVELLEHIVAVKEMKVPADHSVIETRQALALAYQKNGQYKEAIAIQKDLVAKREAAVPFSDFPVLYSQQQLAFMYGDNGQVEEAVALLKDVVAAQEVRLPSHHSSLLLSRQVLRRYETGG
ncbi:hypothetical protein QQX98_000424 [Neonectria punicea]|uniref:Non-haem dioxygenase N-terminal domain-containing protein n=1 Tax=Neonectria punicea TaxID=979145 RepID=A0ABR1HUG1_9HYPO